MYKSLSTKVFQIGTNPNSEPTSWSKLFNYTNMIKSGAFYKAEILLDVLSKNCGVEPMIDTTMKDANKSVKVAFASTMVSLSPPQTFVSFDMTDLSVISP